MFITLLLYIFNALKAQLHGSALFLKSASRFQYVNLIGQVNVIGMYVIRDLIVCARHIWASGDPYRMVARVLPLPCNCAFKPMHACTNKWMYEQADHIRTKFNYACSLYNWIINRHSSPPKE